MEDRQRRQRQRQATVTIVDDAFDITVTVRPHANEMAPELVQRAVEIIAAADRATNMEAT